VHPDQFAEGERRSFESVGITAFLMGSSKSNGCPLTAWSGSAKFSISAGFSTGNKIRLITKRE
jgi:hypothetical protein